jgi:hypothetical protein
MFSILNTDIHIHIHFYASCYTTAAYLRNPIRHRASLLLRMRQLVAGQMIRSRWLWIRLRGTEVSRLIATYLLSGFRALEGTLLALLLVCLRLEPGGGLRLRLQVRLAGQPSRLRLVLGLVSRLVLGWVGTSSEIVVGSHCDDVDLMFS